MDKTNIFDEYATAENSKYAPVPLASLTDGLSREALEHLKEGLAISAPEVLIISA